MWRTTADGKRALNSSPVGLRGAPHAGDPEPPVRLRRLIFINRYYWPDHSATSQILTDLAEALARHQNEQGPHYHVIVVTSRQRLDEPGADLPRRELRNRARIVRLWTTRFGRGRLLGRLFDYLSFYVSAFVLVLLRGRPGDIVVAKTDPPMLGAALSPAVRLRGCTLINWWQDVYPEIAFQLGVLSSDSVLGRVLYWLRNRMARRARVNVVVGEKMRRYLEHFAPDVPCAVIPNWSADLAHTSAPAEPMHPELRTPGRVNFMYSGNAGRAHTFEGLLKAGEALRERDDIRFVFVGDGVKAALVRSQVATRSLGNWVFRPYQPREKLAGSLRAADVHLVTLDPSVEGLIVPSKLYGALAAGRPVLFLGSPEGEVATVLKRYDCGITVPHDDAAGIFKAVTLLAGDAALRSRLGGNARKAYEEEFTPARAVGRWAAVLSTL